MIEVIKGMSYLEAMRALEAQAAEEIAVATAAEIVAAPSVGGSIFSTLGVVVVEGMTYIDAVMAMLL